MDSNAIKASVSYSGKSLASVAREIGQTPQNLSNKLSRGSLTNDELKAIAKALGAEYKSYFEFPNGKKI